MPGGIVAADRLRREYERHRRSYELSRSTATTLATRGRGELVSSPPEGGLAVRGVTETAPPRFGEHFLANRSYGETVGPEMFWCAGLRRAILLYESEMRSRDRSGRRTDARPLSPPEISPIRAIAGTPGSLIRAVSVENPQGVSFLGFRDLASLPRTSPPGSSSRQTVPGLPRPARERKQNTSGSLGEQLGSMDRLDLADGFDLDDDPPLDEQVEPVGG